jgi:hypothetical protein
MSYVIPTVARFFIFFTGPLLLGHHIGLNIAEDVLTVTWKRKHRYTYCKNILSNVEANVMS